MNVAFIPVRGGSKSIPKKNIKQIAGHPLVWWTTKAACFCKAIDKVYVSTDCDKIRSVVSKFELPRLEVISRSKETSTDTASTESAMMEFAEKYNFEKIALIQATSPLVTSDDLLRGFSLLDKNEADSVLSVVRQHRFIWEDDDNNFAKPINYNYTKRPLRQNFDGFLVENGAFYITSQACLLNSGNRLSGRIKTVLMSQESYLEIDNPEDWLLVETLLSKKTKDMMLPEIKMFLCDCDGTLTDGGMYYSEKGEELKKFNTRDAFGLRLLKECGIITGIITAENTNIVVKRGEKMAVDEIIINSHDKLASIKGLCDKYNINLKNVAYIGDDLNDLEAISTIGFTFCPADACKTVKLAAHYVTSANGGEGAVRESAELVMSSM